MQQGGLTSVRTIYFHIGTVKTGSTFIQKFCHENAEYLAANDIAYPHVTPPALELPRFANSAFLWDERSYRSARSLFEAVPESRILISEEGLMGNPGLMNLPVFDGFNKKVILYIRPPAELVTAWAAEKCKPYNASVAVGQDQPGLFSFEKALYQMFHDYIICMDRVKSVLADMSKEDVIVHPFYRSQFKNGSLLLDFLSVFGLSVPFYESAPFNKAHSRKYCDVSYMVWRCLFDLNLLDFYNVHLVERIYLECQSGDDRPAIETLTDEAIEDISNGLEDIEIHFSSRYLQGKPLFAQRLPKTYGTPRHPYEPPDWTEVRRLTRLAVNGRIRPIGA
jgi:hypothetical protein